MLCVAAAVFTVALVAGCTPQPEPDASQQPFATEEEAFAAAEETYRNYVDALNARRADPTASPNPQVFLTGQALEADIRSQQELDQRGIRIEGPTEIVSLVGTSTDLGDGSAQLLVCLDSSSTRVVDSAGRDVTPPDRAELAALDIRVLIAGARPFIESSDPTTADQC